jgi:hypothetical protein
MKEEILKELAKYEKKLQSERMKKVWEIRKEKEGEKKNGKV